MFNLIKNQQKKKFLKKFSKKLQAQYHDLYAKYAG